MVSRAVIVPCDETSGRSVAPLGQRSTDEGVPRGRARIVARPVVEARAQALALLDAAKREADQIRKRAVVEASDVSLQHQARARADALSLVVHQAVELKRRRAELDETLLERSIELARLLAERLLGEQLSLEPGRVTALAQQALREAAGARRAVVCSHPEDAKLLRSELSTTDTPLETLVIETDAGLARGQIRVETELGIVEADLAGQLERLSGQLRQLLRDHD
jgi:flagellar biosynthesis/type III secretory pathway protein FliH